MSANFTHALDEWDDCPVCKGTPSRFCSRPHTELSEQELRVRRWRRNTPTEDDVHRLVAMIRRA